MTKRHLVFPVIPTPLSGAGTGWSRIRTTTTEIPEMASRKAVARDREIQLGKLLSGERLPERPFDRLDERDQVLVADQAEHFMHWRNTRSELNFG